MIGPDTATSFPPRLLVETTLSRSDPAMEATTSLKPQERIGVAIVLEGGGAIILGSVSFSKQFDILLEGIDNTCKESEAK